MESAETKKNYMDMIFGEVLGLQNMCVHQWNIIQNYLSDYSQKNIVAN